MLAPHRFALTRAVAVVGTLIAVGDERGMVRVLGFADGQERTRFQACRGSAVLVGWARDLVVTAANGRGGTVALWREGRLVHRLVAPDVTFPMALAVSPDGRFAAVSGHGDTRVSLFDLAEWSSR